LRLFNLCHQISLDLNVSSCITQIFSGLGFFLHDVRLDSDYCEKWSMKIGLVLVGVGSFERVFKLEEKGSGESVILAIGWMDDRLLEI
jgi:hypothetical protein